MRVRIHPRVTGPTKMYEPHLPLLDTIKFNQISSGETATPPSSASIGSKPATVTTRAKVNQLQIMHINKYPYTRQFLTHGSGQPQSVATAIVCPPPWKR